MEGDEALAKQIGQAKDLLSILSTLSTRVMSRFLMQSSTQVKANMEDSEEDKLPDKEVLGQVMNYVLWSSGLSNRIRSFAFAATDTTSNALSRTLHLLALHPEVQEHLRTEVIEARRINNGDIPYDDLVSLPYMDAVCRETLRLHAPVPNVTRIARQDIVLPLLTPIKGIDGREMDSILVPKDTKIFVAILNANRDPLLWGPDSLMWRPERWLASLPEALHEAHMPGIYSHLSVHFDAFNRQLGLKALFSV
ncbi:hypothetical protein C0995_001098 [Termitomyces sp. Mi166|nr:hypothetical protein C0995_001098 [Termitomyces sp. Mi166\